MISAIIASMALAVSTPTNTTLCPNLPEGWVGVCFPYLGPPLPPKPGNGPKPKIVCIGICDPGDAGGWPPRPPHPPKPKPRQA